MNNSSRRGASAPPNTRLRNALLVASSLIALAGWTTPAAAQPTGDTSAQALDEVVVTARRREERLQDVPVAVTALSSELLEERGVKTTDDLRYAVPSLQVSPSPFGAAVPGYTLRGQRQLESLITQDPSVGIYFADVVQQRPHGTNSALYDLASVQVLKGPQGTLFGRNTTGGAVLFIPAAPTDTFGGSISGVLGNYDLRSATGIINIPISDTLMIRAAGQVTRRDGYVENLTTGQVTDDEQTESARLSVLWNPTDRLTNTLVLNYFHQDDNGTGMLATGIRGPGDPIQPNSPAALTPGALPALARQQARDLHIIENNLQPAARTTAWGISNITTYAINDNLSVKNIFGYRDVDAYNALDFDGLPVSLFETNNLLKTQQISNELQLLGNAFGDRLNYIGGVYYFREEGDDIQNSILGGARINDGSGINISYSAFLQGGYALTDQFTLTAGARYTVDERELEARSKIGAPPLCRLTDAAGVRLNPCSKVVSTTFESPTWLVSLDYKPTDHTLFYLAHRRGYRSGGWNLRSLTPATFIPFKPEIVYDVEAGAKLDLFDRRLRVNAALYRQWYKDIQRTVSFIQPGSPLVQTSVINAADATIDGGEIEISARPADQLELGLNYSITDASYRSFRDACCDLSHNKFTAVPRNQWSAYIRVNVAMDEALGEAGVQLNAYYQDEMEVNDLNTPIKTPAYALLDLTASWKRVMGSAVDISAFVKNMTDENYTTSGVTQYGSDAQHLSLGVQAETIGAPRTFGLELRYHFGAGV